MELVVNDGLIDSLADQLIINTQNSKPVADAGPDQIDKTVGIPVELDGSLSSDADGDALTSIWSLLYQPVGSNAAIQQADQAKATLIPDLPGDYISQLIVNDGLANSDPATALVTVSVAPPVNQPPQITTSPVLTATVGDSYSYDVDATDSDNDTLIYSLSLYPGGMTINAQTGLISWTPGSDQTGAQAITVNVTDSNGGSASQNFDIAVAEAPNANQTTVPEVTGATRTAAQVAIRQARLSPGTETFQHSDTVPDSKVISQMPPANNQVDIGTAVNTVVSLGPNNKLPPNPATVAPKLDATVATTTYAATRFLYSGSNPVQSGVQPGAIDPKRAAVIRGKVLDKQNNPLSDVTITVNKHPELGQTLSRADGLFDMAVNGGGQITVDYRKSGYLPVQRPIQTPWQDSVAAEEVVMLVLDAQVTTIDLSAASMQVAQGSVMTDADGARQATILFPVDTQAAMTLADGTQQPLAALHVRATEYTVGENGPKSMPGPLPPTSGYTYAVELSADEAIAAGAKTVAFDRPVPVYVDNFLNFPVGETVPAGWYDRDKTAWIPSNNGKVIKILSISNQLANLDVDGDGATDAAAKLAALGITSEEQVQLGTLYPAGKSLWRIPTTHFTPWDYNWPYGPPKDGTPPPPPDNTQDPPPEQDSDECKGCRINPQARTVGEELPVTGTPYALHYQSRHAQGYRPDRIVDIALAGAGVPVSLRGIDLSVTVAGQHFTRSFTAAPNQTYRFLWDGLDAYGRPITGSVPATVTVSYRYNPVYYAARSDFIQSFAQAGASADVIGNRAASTIALTRTWQKPLTGNGAAVPALGGWSLSAHHGYDAVHRTLALGTGERRAADDVGRVITTVAGTGQNGYGGDGGPAAQAKFSSPWGIAAGPDGSLYIADSVNNRIRRLGMDGITTTVADAFGPQGIAVGPDGSLYIADTNNHRIRRVGVDGITTTVAGNGVQGYLGDGGPATQAKLYYPQGIAIGPDGSLYIADAFNHRIRRVGADGIITTMAGTGVQGVLGDGGPATQARLQYPSDIAVGSDGSLYIAEPNSHRIRRVGTDGIITTAAGTGEPGFAGDGGLAVQAKLSPSSDSPGRYGRHHHDRGRYRRTRFCRRWRPSRAGEALSLWHCARPGWQPLFRGCRQSPHPPGGRGRHHHHRGRDRPKWLWRRRRPGRAGATLSPRYHTRRGRQSLYRGYTQSPHPPGGAAPARI